MTEAGGPHPSDAELIARAQDGEVRAFGELYERYLDPIYRYIRSRVEAEADAEDLCESVFMRSFEALERYEDQGHPYSAYLYRLARNSLVDYYRAGRMEFDLERADRELRAAADLDHRLDQREQLRSIAEALASLPEDYGEVIRLRLVLEFPTDSVAEWMQRSPGAVRVLLHRALKALRERLIDEPA